MLDKKDVVRNPSVVGGAAGSHARSVTCQPCNTITYRRIVGRARLQDCPPGDAVTYKVPPTTEGLPFYSLWWGRTPLPRHDSCISVGDVSNVQLLASPDPTMCLLPKGWRVAFIETDLSADRHLCAEQTDQHGSCIACGYCFRKSTGNVVFRVD